MAPGTSSPAPGGESAPRCRTLPVSTGHHGTRDLATSIPSRQHPQPPASLAIMFPWPPVSPATSVPGLQGPLATSVPIHQHPWPLASLATIVPVHQHAWPPVSPSHQGPRPPMAQAEPPQLLPAHGWGSPRWWGAPGRVHTRTRAHTHARARAQAHTCCAGANTRVGPKRRRLPRVQAPGHAHRAEVAAGHLISAEMGHSTSHTHTPPTCTCSHPPQTHVRTRRLCRAALPGGPRGGDGRFPFQIS